jgi:hypothetical protein
VLYLLHFLNYIHLNNKPKEIKSITLLVNNTLDLEKDIN